MPVLTRRHALDLTVQLDRAKDDFIALVRLGHWQACRPVAERPRLPRRASGTSRGAIVAIVADTVGDQPDAPLDQSRLDELISRYLSPATPVHREDSTVEVVVDGREWMLRMRELLCSTSRGDAVYICGLSAGPRHGPDWARAAGAGIRAAR